MTTIYGIRNCDTMKRAFTWLKEHDVAHEFHDYKKSGIDVSTLKSWSKRTGYETLLNTRGTTWRKLSDRDRADMNEQKAIKLMSENPSLIKRPVLASGKSLLVGFKAGDYEALFGK